MCNIACVFSVKFLFIYKKNGSEVETAVRTLAEDFVIIVDAHGYLQSRSCTRS